MDYRVVWKPSPGFTLLSKPGDAGMQHLSFGMVALASGEHYRLTPCDRETALVLLRGAAVVTGGGLERQAIGPRADFFQEKPWTVMLPAQTGCDVEATADCEIAVSQAVDLGASLSTDESADFLNGLLGKALRTLRETYPKAARGEADDAAEPGDDDTDDPEDDPAGD